MNSQPPSESAAYLKSNIGKRITLEGRTATSKAGAFLFFKGHSIWMQGLQAWPDELNSRTVQGKHVRATGILMQDQGLPVVHAVGPDQPQSSGIPVPRDQDLEQAAIRWVLQDFSYEQLNE